MRRIRAMAVAFASLAAVIAFPTSVAGAATGLPSQLTAGHRWTFPQSAASPSGKFFFNLFSDGGMSLDEVVHLAGQPRGATTEFHSWDGVAQDINRKCPHAFLDMQLNGNLVFYCRTGDALWSTHTTGTGTHNHFTVQDDGDLVVYNGAGHRVWASGSTASMITTGQHLDPGQRIRIQEWDHPFVSLTMQRDGDLVLNYGRRVAWRSGTHTPGSRLLLSAHGDLVVQGPAGRVLWSTRTAGIGAGAALCVFDDGRIAEARLTGPHGTIRWSRSG